LTPKLFLTPCIDVNNIIYKELKFIMAFLRHIGRIGDRKVAVIFREVPGETHMALVAYPELLNRHVHDPLMQCIESQVGQQAIDLAEALNRTYTKDGSVILQKLHAEGQLKKVKTELVVMTPAPGIQIKLSELNQILDQMEQGEAATKKLAEMDSQLGLQDPVAIAKRLRGDKDATFANPSNLPSDVLGNDSIANNLRAQAAKMLSEAKGLVAEAERLQAEATALVPVTSDLNPGDRVSSNLTDKPVQKSRGRQKKAAVSE